MRARRVPVVDEYVEAGGSVVLLGDQVLTLSSVATAALAALGDAWAPLDEVARALEQAFGAPPEGSIDAATEETLTALAELGLVEVETAP